MAFNLNFLKRDEAERKAWESGTIRDGTCKTCGKVHAKEPTTPETEVLLAYAKLIAGFSFHADPDVKEQINRRNVEGIITHAVINTLALLTMPRTLLTDPVMHALKVIRARKGAKAPKSAVQDELERKCIHMILNGHLMTEAEKQRYMKEADELNRICNEHYNRPDKKDCEQ